MDCPPASRASRGPRRRQPAFVVVVVAVIALVALAIGVRPVPGRCSPPARAPTTCRTSPRRSRRAPSAYLARQFQTLGVFVVLAFVLLLCCPRDDTGDADRPLGLLRRRRGVLGVDRLPRHVPGDAGQRPRRRGRPRGGRPRAGHEDRLPHRRRGRHVHRRPRPARRRRRRADLQGRRPDGARGLRLRRRAARDVHAGRRRHLHQGRRRRRRPGRQGRAGHPRGRPAQRRHHRRQRRRQRRRLRRHGRRPVRVVRRDAGRRADPRHGGLRRAGPGLPADRPGHRRAHRDHRRLHHPGRGRRERPDDDQPGFYISAAISAVLSARRGLRLPAGHLRRARTAATTRSSALSGDPRLIAVARRRHRHRAGRRHPGADRLLHRHRARARSRTSARPR